MDEPMSVRFMTADAIIASLTREKELLEVEDGYTVVITDQVNAIDAAVAILSALQDEGVHDAEAVRDLIQDYRKLAKQYQTMHQRYEVASKPIHKDGVWHCPQCNHRIAPKHSHCHWCGKRLGWR